MQQNQNQASNSQKLDQPIMGMNFELPIKSKYFGNDFVVNSICFYSFVIRMMHLWRPAHVLKDEFVWRKREKSDYIVFVMKGSLVYLEDNFYVDQASSETNNYKRQNPLEVDRLTHRFSADLSASKNYGLPKQTLPEEPLANQGNESKVEILQNLLKSQYFIFKEFASGSYLGDEELLLKSNRKYHLSTTGME